MNHGVHIYLITMFWLGILSLICSAVRLVSDHPRVPKPVNIGTDVFGMLVAIVALAWVSVLLYSG